MLLLRSLLLFFDPSFYLYNNKKRAKINNFFIDINVNASHRLSALSSHSPLLLPSSSSSSPKGLCEIFFDYFPIDPIYIFLFSLCSPVRSLVRFLSFSRSNAKISWSKIIGKCVCLHVDFIRALKALNYFIRTNTHSHPESTCVNTILRRFPFNT